MQLSPWDESNQRLAAHAHPPEWRNPTPAGRYNLAVVGGGAAGLVSAMATAGLGGKAALVERYLLGGDCLNYGCVPSKALIRSARAVHDARQGARYGFQALPAAQSQFAEVMLRMRRLRADISRNDAAQRFRDHGVDVFFGEARFTAPDRIEVDGRTIVFRRAVIAAGARPAEPAIDGLVEVGYLTNETVFSLVELPRRLAVLGGGPIGCELAQAFVRFGAEVHLIDRNARLLGKEDPEAAAVVERQLQSEGVHLHLACRVERVERTGDSKSLLVTRNGERQKLIADQILVAVGRRPNVESLDLPAAGVQHSERGVTVNDFLQTTNHAVYAAGDICGQAQFTHAADAMARICVQNALFLGRKRLSRLVIPRCTYTDPELAHVGLTPAEAAERGIAITSHRVDMADVDRAVLDGREDGFAVVHVRARSAEVVGATVVAEHAGEMIGEITLLITHKLPLGALAATIHPYPTQAEALKRVADAYNRSRLTPRVARLLSRWLAWRR